MSFDQLEQFCDCYYHRAYYNSYINTRIDLRSLTVQKRPIEHIWNHHHLWSTFQYGCTTHSTARYMLQSSTAALCVCVRMRKSQEDVRREESACNITLLTHSSALPTTVRVLSLTPFCVVKRNVCCLSLYTALVDDVGRGFSCLTTESSSQIARCLLSLRFVPYNFITVLLFMHCFF